MYNFNIKLKAIYVCVSLFTLYYILHYFLFHIGSLFAHGCVLQVSEIANPKINVSLFPSFCLLVDFLLLRYFTMFSPQKKAFFWKRDFDFVHQWNTPADFLGSHTCTPINLSSCGSQWREGSPRCWSDRGIWSRHQDN